MRKKWDKFWRYIKGKGEYISGIWENNKVLSVVFVMFFVLFLLLTFAPGSIQRIITKALELLREHSIEIFLIICLIFCLVFSGIKYYKIRKEYKNELGKAFLKIPYFIIVYFIIIFLSTFIFASFKTNSGNEKDLEFCINWFRLIFGFSIPFYTWRLCYVFKQYINISEVNVETNIDKNKHELNVVNIILLAFALSSIKSFSEYFQSNRDKQGNEQNSNYLAILLFVLPLISPYVLYKIFKISMLYQIKLDKINKKEENGYKDSSK